MDRYRAIRTLLGVSLMVFIPSLVAAQGTAPTPEGREWHLISYTVDGESQDVPGDVSVTLLLEDGQASGSAGCQGYAADYEIQGKTLGFTHAGPTSEVGCPDEAAQVEEAYLAALPTIDTWAIDTGPTPGDIGLILSATAGDTILQFVEPSVGTNFADIRALTDLVNAQRRQIDRLTSEVVELREQAEE